MRRAGHCPGCRTGPGLPPGFSSVLVRNGSRVTPCLAERQHSSPPCQLGRAGGSGQELPRPAHRPRLGHCPRRPPKASASHHPEAERSHPQPGHGGGRSANTRPVRGGGGNHNREAAAHGAAARCQARLSQPPAVPGRNRPPGEREVRQHRHGRGRLPWGDAKERSVTGSAAPGPRAARDPPCARRFRLPARGRKWVGPPRASGGV